MDIYYSFLFDFFNIFLSHLSPLSDDLSSPTLLISSMSRKRKGKEQEEDQERRRRRSLQVCNQPPHHPKQNQTKNPRENPFRIITNFLRQNQNHHRLEPTPFFLALSESSCCLSPHSYPI